MFNTGYRRFLARRCCRFNGAAGAAGAGRAAGGDAGAAAWAAGAGREAGAMLGPVEVLEPLGALPCRLGRHPRQRTPGHSWTRQGKLHVRACAVRSGGESEGGCGG